jgi:hypothetical protein
VRTTLIYVLIVAVLLAAVVAGWKWCGTPV